MSASTIPESALQLPPVEPASVPSAEGASPSASAAPVGGFARFATPVTPTTRLVSLDAYRGFIMLAMASGGLAIPGVVRAMARANPGQEPSAFWQFLAFHTDHVPWVGCSFWDLIQPSFMFMVGVALPYSFASRLAKGQSQLKIYGHALWRSFLLIALGIFLSSNWSKQTDFVFVNVLAQIGLGYFFLYFLVNRGRLVQLAALAVILGGYWLWFYAFPLPPADFNYKSVGVPADWPELLTGTFAHWNKNVNAAAYFDQWFLNLFPQPERVNPLTGEKVHEFFFNNGGYQTLNFIPSLATMLLGLMAGELLRSIDYTNIEKFIRLAGAGIVCLVAGMILGETVCPIVKRIWTPSWVLYSGGFTFFMLAGFYLVIDIWGFQRWTWPLLVVGMNSIVIYCMAQLTKPWLSQTWKIHIGYLYTQAIDWMLEKEWIGPGWKADFGDQLFGGLYGPIVQATAVLFVWWLICVRLYRQKIFVRI
jgi:predicted acyltransferase